MIRQEHSSLPQPYPLRMRSKIRITAALISRVSDVGRWNVAEPDTDFCAMSCANGSVRMNNAQRLPPAGVVDLFSGPLGNLQYLISRRDRFSRCPMD
jgi:hypothetical protein